LLGLLFDPEDGGDMFLRNVYFTGIHSVITQTIQLFSVVTRPQIGRPANLVSIPGRGKIFLILHSVQTGSGTHPVSYPMGTRGPRKR
jgi:hypothetical protein